MPVQKRSILRVLEAAPWRAGRAAYLWRLRSPAVAAEGDLEPRLLAAADWLERCQDAGSDGGLAGRYRFRGGWTASYPEATGYTIPTLLRLADRLSRGHLVDRAERAVTFLLDQQSEDGAFPGGEVGAGSDASVFNTAQILSGLDAWDAAQGDPRATDAASAAADWLLRVQHDDGAWRDYTYGGLACAYYAHASCWIARFGARVDEPRYREAASRHVAWVLGRQDPASGWIDTAGFPRDHARRVAETHTLGYMLYGLLLSAEALELSEPVEVVRRAAREIAGVLEAEGWLPGRLDHVWRPRAGYACVTGNAQLAQVWDRLAREGHHVGRFRKAASESLWLALGAQPVETTERGLRGGLPGSAPAWGDYLPNTFPSWAVKFAIDALLDGAGGAIGAATPGSR